MPRDMKMPSPTGVASWSPSPARISASNDCVTWLSSRSWIQLARGAHDQLVYTDAVRQAHHVGDGVGERLGRGGPTAREHRKVRRGQLAVELDGADQSLGVEHAGHH